MKNQLITLLLVLTPALVFSQLKNLDFENWQHSKLPADWSWSNGQISYPDNDFYNEKNGDAQNNNYAITLSIWYNHTKDMAFQRAAIDHKPVSLSGYYKYTENLVSNGLGEIPDTAQVTVILSKWNKSKKERETIGRGVLNLNNSAEYSKFNCVVNYTSNETPDSIYVLLDCSLVNREENNYTSSPAVASYFTVDNLVVENAALSTAENDPVNLIVYPNPASNELFIPNYSGSVQIINIEGKVVLNSKIQSGESISIKHFSPGSYLVRLENQKSNFTQKILIH